ncbi:MAG TPA: hypothetical protein VE465_12190 [Streptosporangiaceae bacterium]|jgi:hypothetical protein|nr:hypothetical protein [Streptosporangiaceae bacterium]
MSITAERDPRRTPLLPAPREEPHECAPTAPERRLCRGCLTLSRKILRALPLLYEDCVHAIDPPPRGHVIEKVSGTRPVHSVNETAVDARTNIEAVLASWAGLVAGERRLPASGGDVGHLTRFLTAHLDWLAAHPGAADFVAEIGELVAGTLSVIDARPADMIELGRCIEPGCAGLLSARRPGHDAGSAPEVGCDSGRHAWRPDQWLLLRRRLDRASRA